MKRDDHLLQGVQLLRSELDKLSASDPQVNRCKVIAGRLEWRADGVADEIRSLRAALSDAVEMYGKPGGPWNVPSDPGGWLSRAREALAPNAEVKATDQSAEGAAGGSP